MEPNLIQKIEEQQAKIDQIYISVEKTRKYFFWTMVITAALVVLPAIGLLFVIPSYLGQLNEIQNIGN